MIEALQRFFRAAAQRQDLIIVFFILLVTALMILPLPTWLMDVMIAINITIGILFLMLAIYLKSPLEFSTLPSAILISTLVRMAITISTTRLILVQGDAGSIVASFGEFVVGGNVVVGLVIFTIIAIAQFIVITKGSERVAEVGARFVLDALPGKQMSIDSDLRAGDIDRVEAKRRRSTLERESQYYGAMDGAMKFVKGDAIVSMIVIFVNLLGGLIVGTTVRGMDAATAFKTYALLTVGDGLSAQIPALLVAVSGGIVVTRVTTDASENLGSDLARELASSSQSLAIVAATLAALAIVPGFPALTFLGLAAVVGGGSYLIAARDRKAATATALAASTAGATAAAAAATGAPATTRAALTSSQPGDTYAMKVAADLGGAIDRTRLAEALRSVVGDANSRHGIKVAVPGFMVDDELPDGTAQFFVDGAPAWRGHLPAGQMFVPGDERLAEVDDLAEAERAEVPGLGSGLWVANARARPLTAKGFQAYGHEDVLGAVARGLVGRWSARAFGLQDADQWLNDLAQKGHAPLVQLARQVPLVRIADTLRHLLSEGVSITHPRLVLEGLVELAPKVDDNQLLADHLRLHLSRPISAAYADTTRTIPAYVVELDLEETLRRSTREGPTGVRLSLDYDSAERLSGELKACFPANEAKQPQTVLMTAFDTRRLLRHFAMSKGLDIPVLAFEEIASDYHVMPVGSLTEQTVSGGRN